MVALDLNNYISEYIPVQINICVDNQLKDAFLFTSTTFIHKHLYTFLCFIYLLLTNLAQQKNN